MSDDGSGDDWEALEDAGKLDTNQIDAELKRLKRAEAERVRLYEILSRPRQSNFADSEAHPPPRIEVNQSTSDHGLLKELSDQNGIKLAMQWNWDDPLELNSAQRSRAPGNNQPEDKITDITDITDITEDAEDGVAGDAADAADFRVPVEKGYASARHVATFGRIGADKATATAADADADDASWDAAGPSAAVAADEAAETAGNNLGDGTDNEETATGIPANSLGAKAEAWRVQAKSNEQSNTPLDDMERKLLNSLPVEQAKQMRKELDAIKVVADDGDSAGGRAGGAAVGDGLGSDYEYVSTDPDDDLESDRCDSDYDDGSFGGGSFNLFGPDPAASGTTATAGLPGLKVGSAAPLPPADDENPGLFDGMTVCDECGVPKLKGYTDAEVNLDLWYCTACWSIWLAEKADEERRRTVAAIYAEHDREVDEIVDGMEANTDKTDNDVMQKLLDLVIP